MSGLKHHLIATLRLAAVAVLLTAALSRSAEAPPIDPSEIVGRTVDRATHLAKQGNNAVYLYDKRTTIESLDADGNTTSSKTKLFKVTMRGGVPDARLIEIEGRKLTPEEIAKEDEKIRRRRQAFLNQDSADGKPTRKTFVPADLARRFALNWERTENLLGRPTHVIAFAPRQPTPKAKTLADRVVNRLSGEIWIDAEDSEVARIEVELGERVKLWGGLIGLLNDFSYSLRRLRSPEGVWHNSQTEIGLDARGLLVKPLRFHVTEQSSHFRKEPSAASQLPDAARQDSPPLIKTGE